MNYHPALSAPKAFERLQEAFRRYSTVCTALGEIADAFEKTPDIEGDGFDVPAQMLARLPDALLARALADEILGEGAEEDYNVNIRNDDTPYWKYAWEQDFLTPIYRDPTMKDSWRIDTEFFRGFVEGAHEVHEEVSKRI